MLMMALRKLIAPGIEETPTKCREQNRKVDGSSSMSSFLGMAVTWFSLSQRQFAPRMQVRVRKRVGGI